MRMIYVIEGEPISIGREGEHHAVQVYFNIAQWVKVYGEGRVELLYQRRNDPAPYPIAVEQDGDHVVWTVTSADTAQPGRYGQAELRYYVEDTLVKSAISRVEVTDALGEPAELAPAPYQNWVDRVLDAAQRAEHAAQRAEGAEGGLGDGAWDHARLSNRDAADQHPVKAITGLEEALASVNSPALKWFGKTMNFLGDSITEGYASTQCYVDILAEQLGAVCNNYGIGGSTVADGQDPMYSRALSMNEDADLVLVFGGTNDFANYDRVLGTQFVVSGAKRTLNLDTSTFYGGLNQLCTNLYSRFPYSTLVLCTPLNRQSFAGQETDLQANGNGLYLDEYVEAIKKVAAYFSIPCLDLYATANLHPYDGANITKYYSASDQLHPNAEGHKHLAKVMRAFFETLADKRGGIADDGTGDDTGEEEITLLRISAVYSGGDVEAGTSVDDLTGIAVTAEYSDGSTKAVTGYTLSGTITQGSNTITVSYGGLTTTFAVTGVEAVVPEHLVHSFTAANATSEVWVDDIDPSCQFDFTGSPTVENGLVTFSSSSHGILNKSLNMGGMDAALAIRFAVDTSMEHTWVLGTPDWQNGIIIGRHTNRFAVDSKFGNVYLNMDDGDVHDFVLSYRADTNNMAVYFDSTPVGTLSADGLENWLSGLLKLNNESASYNGANSIQDIKIFDKALTEDEVTALWASKRVKIADYTMRSGLVFNNDGGVYESETEGYIYTCEDFIPVSSGKGYRIVSPDFGNRNVFVHGYDENKASTGWILFNVVAPGFVVPSGTAFIRMGRRGDGVVESITETLYELCEEESGV